MTISNKEGKRITIEKLSFTIKKEKEEFLKQIKEFAEQHGDGQDEHKKEKNILSTRHKTDNETENKKKQEEAKNAKNRGKLEFQLSLVSHFLIKQCGDIAQKNTVYTI